MQGIRGWMVVGTVAAVAGMGACGGEEGAPEAAGAGATAAFCDEVTPRVRAFMATVRDTAEAMDGPRYGGTAVVGGLGEIRDGMNAFVVGDYASRQHQQFVNLMTLVRYDGDLVPQPYLAESWELSDDATELTFHLRDDVFWHDGEPTDAEDVAFTYRRLMDPATGYPNPASWSGYIGGEDGVEVVDAHTVRVHLKPRSEPLDPWTTAAVMPEHLLGDVPPEALGRHPFGTQCPVGNGPFVFLEHRPQDRWVFESNPAFPAELGGRPYLDRYVFRVIPEQTTLLTELLTGGLDVYVTPPPDQADAILDAPDAELRRYDFPNFVFVAWNSRRPQLSDPRVRRAITRGVDREEVVEAILGGYATVANSGVPPFHWAFDASMGEGLAHDPAAARALLEEAGWIDRDGDGVRENAEGTPLSFTIKYNQGSRQRQSVAEIMQAQLADIGIDARPEMVEYATLLDQIMTPGRRDFDGVVMSFVTEFRLDETDLFHSRGFDGPLGWSGTQNPRLDTLLDELRTTVARDDARGLWAEYQTVLAREQPFTYFYFPDRLDGVSTRLHGATMDARGEWLTLKDWWIEER